MTEKKNCYQHRFGNMESLMLKSSSVFQLNFGAKLKFCATNSPTSASNKKLSADLLTLTTYDRTNKILRNIYR